MSLKNLSAALLIAATTQILAGADPVAELARDATATGALLLAHNKGNTVEANDLSSEFLAGAGFKRVGGARVAAFKTAFNELRARDPDFAKRVGNPAPLMASIDASHPLINNAHAEHAAWTGLTSPDGVAPATHAIYPVDAIAGKDQALVQAKASVNALTGRLDAMTKILLASSDDIRAKKNNNIAQALVVGADPAANDNERIAAYAAQLEVLFNEVRAAAGNRPDLPKVDGAGNVGVISDMAALAVAIANEADGTDGDLVGDASLAAILALDPAVSARITALKGAFDIFA